MLKKFTLGLFLLFASLNSYAGEYDGVWLFDGETDYYTIYQNGNELLVVQLNANLESWDATIGTITENIAEMKTLMTKADEKIEYTLTFSSSITATQTIVSCTGTACSDGPGASFTMKKIY